MPVWLLVLPVAGAVTTYLWLLCLPLCCVLALLRLGTVYHGQVPELLLESRDGELPECHAMLKARISQRLMKCRSNLDADHAQFLRVALVHGGMPHSDTLDDWKY